MRILGIFCIASTLWAGDSARDACGQGDRADSGVTEKLVAGLPFLPSPGAASAGLFRTAREHGIAVDETLARASAVRGFGVYADVDRAIQYHHVIDPALDDGYRLLGGEAAGVRPSITTAIYARLIAARQRADGSWDTLDVRPPQSYSKITATAIASRAIQIYGHQSLAADTKSRVDRARNWLMSTSAHSSEERVMKLYGALWTGADAAQIAKLERELQATQQGDGGWGAVEGRASDVYSTAEAMVALAETDPRQATEAAWKRGVQFLLREQAADGSWHTKSRVHPPAPVSPQYFETGYPYGHDQFVSIMGATWAIRALALSLPAAGRTGAPALSELRRPPSNRGWRLRFSGARANLRRCSIRD